MLVLRPTITYIHAGLVGAAHQGAAREEQGDLSVKTRCSVSCQLDYGGSGRLRRVTLGSRLPGGVTCLSHREKVSDPPGKFIQTTTRLAMLCLITQPAS